MSREYHHGDLRAALLAAAEAELAERGVEGFSLRGCARRAAVSHAAPAHHFGDADGLLTALAAEGFARFAAAVRARQAVAAKEGLAPLMAAGLGYLDFARANEALFRLMFASSRPDHDDVALGAASRDAFGLLARAVAAARGADPFGDAEGLLDVVAAWAIAHGIADLVVAGQLWFLRGEVEADPDGVALAIMARLALAAPAAEPPAAPPH